MRQVLLAPLLSCASRLGAPQADVVHRLVKQCYAAADCVDLVREALAIEPAAPWGKPGGDASATNTEIWNGTVLRGWLGV